MPSLYTNAVTWILQAIGVLAFAIVSSVVLEELRRPRNMPPTPGNKRPLPFLGNRLDIPKEKSWMTFRKWNERYGPILTVWNGKTPIILISDPEIAVELMEKRSSKYSSRPRFVVAGDLLTQNRTILFAPYGDRFRAYRRILHLGTMQKSVDTYRPIFVMEGKALCADLIQDPVDWYQHIYRYTASSVVTIAYGRRVTDIRTDKAYQRLTTNNEFLIRINVPGAQWHETFPVLRFLPSFINKTKRIALEYRQSGRENLAALVDEVRRKMAMGVAPPSFSRRLLEQRDKFSELDDVEFNQAPGSVFAAGVDTTSATLQSLILAMVLHPEVQKSAHTEIDNVIGPNRSPTWDDEDKLPYLDAVIKETMRWRPVAILGGTSHASTEDDVFAYEGKDYFIPKGSIIMGCLWSIHMNPKVYEDPELYNPDRFLHGRDYAGTGGKGHSSFGWGRRACPGAYLAERSLYITVARLLWGFAFSKAIEPATGQEIEPDASMGTGYTSGFNCRPRPFACLITPRSASIKEIMQREAAEALDELRVFENYYD